MTNDHKPPPLETTIQLHDHNTTTIKVAADGETGTMNGRMVTSTKKYSLNYDIALIVLRFVSLAASLISVFVMISAEEKSSISIYGFNLPLYSKWSFSGSFQYLVGVSAVVGVHSFIQLVMMASRMLKKSLVFPSMKHAWLIFVVDQVFAYMMVSAGSAATGVTNLNRTGIQHAPLPNFCKPLHQFCDRVGVSIAFSFFNCVLLAISVVLDVIWLSN